MTWSTLLDGNGEKKNGPPFHQRKWIVGKMIYAYTWKVKILMLVSLLHGITFVTTPDGFIAILVGNTGWL